MQVSVEKISSVERRLTVVVPAIQVEEAYNKQINQFARNANIKGFRPGKAPLSFIQKRFGADARKEALNEVIQSSLYQALQDEHLIPVSTPHIEPKTYAFDQPLEYVASFEVLPEIETINFTLEQVEKPIVEVNDQDIKRVIEQLQKQLTKWHSVEREVKQSDRVVIDYYAIFEGKSEEDKKIDNFPLEIGSKLMIPGFEDGLLGAKIDEVRHLKLNFPEPFVDDRAGKPVEFVVTIKEIFEADIPPLDQDFVKQLGIQSGEEADLRNQIHKTLSQETERLVREKIKEQIFKNLLEQNKIEVPASLIKNEAQKIHDELYPQQHAHNHSNDEMQTFNDIAQKRVALGLLIAAYAKKLGLQADKARVNKRMQEIAAAYEQPEEVMAWLNSKERKAGVEAQVLEDQVMEKLIENITVIDKNMSYADLKGIRI